MKFTDLEDAGTVNERLDRIEKAIDKLDKAIEKLNDRFDQWLRWIIGLQLGAYILIIGGYFCANNGSRTFSHEPFLQG